MSDEAFVSQFDIRSACSGFYWRLIFYFCLPSCLNSCAMDPGFQALSSSMTPIFHITDLWSASEHTLHCPSWDVFAFSLPESLTSLNLTYPHLTLSYSTRVSMDCPEIGNFAQISQVFSEI